jgi:hypothetical protein
MGPTSKPVSKPVKRLKEQIGLKKKGKQKKDRLCFGQRSQVRFLFPTVAVLRSPLFVHGAPSRADHLEQEIARGGTAATASPPPAPPGSECEWEERKGNDTFVLVASEELALDSAALDVLLEPCKTLGARVIVRREDW